MTALRFIALLAAFAGLSACGGGSSSSGGPLPAAVQTTSTQTQSQTQTQTQVQANRAPSIAGSPQVTAFVDVPYSFIPTASDADGDTLTFSIVNKPSWADFDTTTGRLAGLPRLGDLGSVSDVTISVSDGKATTSLASFSLVVRNPPGTANLSWVAPTTNTDGSTLVDLVGYRIYHGTDPADLSNRVDVSDPRALAYTIRGLAAGTWYFSMTSVNSTGIESARTGSVSLVVQ